MTISRSSASSKNVLFIFEMHNLNGALFLNATFFSDLPFSFGAAAKNLLSLLQQYMPRYSHINMILASFKPYIFVNRILTT